LIACPRTPKKGASEFQVLLFLMLLFCFLLLHNLFAIVDDYSLEAGADTLTSQVVVAVVSLGV